MKLSLSKTECDVLYNKYIDRGLTHYQAISRIKKVKGYLSDVISEMRVKKLSDDEINLRFVEEFHKVLQDTEGRNET